jgi:hypothetical protein
MPGSKNPPALNNLPQFAESWYVAVRQLSIKIEIKNGPKLQPYVIIVFEPKKEMMVGVQPGDHKPSSDDVYFFLLETMTNPEAVSRRKPGKPMEVQFEQDELYQALQAGLAKLDIAAIKSEKLEIMDEIIADLSEMLQSGGEESPPPPGLLSVEGVTPKMAADLFEAGAVFYRAKPWEKLADIQPIAVQLDPPGQQGFVQLLGQGELEYGLALYWKWEDVLRTLMPSDNPLDHIPEDGWHLFTFIEKDLLPPEDIKAMKRYGWKVADKHAYPLPGTMYPDSYERPDPQEILAYTALLKTLPGFVDSLRENDLADYDPLEQVKEISTSAGPLTVTLRYPGGEIPEELLFDEYEDEDEFEDEEIEVELSAELEQANQIMMMAQIAKDPAERIRLAHQALDTCDECAEACILLAEEEAQTPEEALEWFTRGMDAGKRSLGEDFFEEYEGEFWNATAAHPFLRACQGRADVLNILGQEDEAATLYDAILTYNLDDHQGVRYPLLSLLLKLGHDDEAQELLDDYEGDEFATWPYSQALLCFRREGNSKTARQRLKEAIKQNAHVVPFLTGSQPIPETAPEFTGFGDESEAIHYALEHYAYWWETPGAIDWLKRHQG